MTQSGFAKELSTTNVTVSRWEAGKSRPNRKKTAKLNELWESIPLTDRAKIKQVWYYPTNDWNDYRWVKVQTWKNGKRSKWIWYPADKVKNFHENNSHTLIFQTISHYEGQDTGSSQISNLCFDWDVSGDDWIGNFERCRVAVLTAIEFFWDLGLDENEIRVFFSGGRSYHLEIPYQCLGIEPKIELNRFMKLLALDVNEYIIDKNGDYALEIDDSLYANPKMYRTPNSRYPKGEDYPPHGTYKIDLNHKQVQEIERIEELWELAREPKPPLYDTDVFSTYEPKPDAVEWYQEIKEQFDEYKETTEHVPTYIDDDTIKLMDDLPACIKDLRTNGIKEIDTRNKATLCDACWCKSSGINENKAFQTINAWVQKIPMSLSDTPKGKKREYATKSVIKSVYGNDKYKFSCGAAKKLGLKCNRNQCPLYRKYDLRNIGKKIKKVENVELPKDNIHYVDTIFEAREYLKDKITDSVFNSDSAIFTPPPGIGKTHIAIETVEKLLPRFLYAGARHENCNFVYEEIAQRADSWTQVLPRRPRSPKPKEKELIQQWKASALCPLFEKADLLAKLRYNVGKILCSESSSAWCGIPKEVCDWWRQFSTDKSATIVHEYLFIPTLTDMLIGEYETFEEYDNIASEAPVVVLDEPAPDSFIEKVIVSIKTITKTIEKTEHDCIRELLQLVRKVIEDTLPNGKNSPLFGNAVMKAILDTYDGNFEHLIRHVQDTVTKPNFVDIEADSLLDGREKAYQVTCNGKTLWIPKEWEVVISRDRLLFRVPYDFAKDNDILPKTNGLNAEKEEHGLILQFVDDLARTLKIEYERYKTDQAYNSALSIEKTLEGNSLVMRLRKYLQVPEDVPLLLLDANGDRELLSYLTERELKEYHASVKMDCRIVQILDGKYGITTLFSRKKGEPNKPKSSFWRLVQVVKQIAEQEEPSKILIITWKVLEDVLVHMQKEGKLPSEISINHFGNIRGSNENENREIAIILGTPCPKPTDMMMQAQALYYEKEPVSAELESYEKAYNYKDKDGNGWKIEMERYKDKRLEAIRRRYREMEIYQAAHRIRPILEGGKTIYLLTNLPIDLLPPDEMYLVDDLTDMTDPEYQQFERNLLDFAEQNGGIWLELGRSFTDVTLHQLTRWFDLVCRRNGLGNSEVIAIDETTRITVHYRNELNPTRVKVAFFLEKNDLAGLRKSFGLTQKEFAEKLGYTNIYINYVEKGKKAISSELVKAIYENLV